MSLRDNNYLVEIGFFAVNKKYNPININGMLSHCPVENIVESPKPPWLSFIYSTTKRTLHNKIKKSPKRSPCFSAVLVFQYRNNSKKKTNM